MKRKKPQAETDPEVTMPTSVRSLKTYFRNFHLDMRAPCTDRDCSDTLDGVESPQRLHGCWLTTKVGVWNRFFENIGVELRQSWPGKLSIYTFAPYCIPCRTDFGLVCATLLGELISIHRCICFVHLGYADVLFSIKPSVFDHLIPNAGLQRLELWGRCMQEQELYGLIKAMFRGRLMSVQISTVTLGQPEVSMISDYVKSTTSLTKLSLVDAGLKVVDTVAVFKALEYSKTVECLKLEMNTVGIRGAQQFAKLLKKNKVLKSVTLQKVKLQAKGAMAIASALAQNSTLTALRIASNGIGPTGTRALADALKINHSLELLDLRDNAMGSEGAQAVSEMLAVNAKLEELHLCGNAISDSGIAVVANSLHHNKTLKVLWLFANGFGENGVAALATLLTRNETLQRLHASLGANYGDMRPLEAFANALASNKNLRAVQLSVSSSPAMKQLSHALRMIENIECLCVSTSGPEIEQLCSALETNYSIREIEFYCPLRATDGASLARLFEANTTIQAVTITKNVSVMCLIRMFRGLAKNRSICWFSIQCRALRKKACAAIAATLEVNKTLCCITLGGPSTDEESLSVLSNGVAKNNLVQILELGCTPCSSAGLKIRERLRCNLSTMLKAIEFVLAHTVERLGAEVFEMYKKNPYFHRELGKAATNIGRPSALELIRETERFIEDNYFRITAVVKHDIVCVRPAGKCKNQATMLDELNKYCLNAVLSHLRVSDVKM